MKDLDLTLDYMENARFNYIYGPIIAHIESPFTNSEVLCLAMIYHKFALENGVRSKFMTLKQLGSILELIFNLTDREINRRIVTRISDDCSDKKYSGDSLCTFESFIKVFAIYFSTDLEKRMQFAFSIYDHHNRGYLDREQVSHYVQKFFVGEDEDEIYELRADMVDLLFAKFDFDKDMFISNEEYYDIVRKQPKMLEFLGTVFPTPYQLETVRHIANLLS